MTYPARRTVLRGGFALIAAATASAACSSPGSGGAAGHAANGSSHFPSATPLTPSPGQGVVTKTLTAKATTLDLAGTELSTWAFDGVVPGPLVRATAGQLLRLKLDNQLTDPSTIHWHGIALRNVADGVPGLTQEPVAAGSAYLYEFIAPDPGTYFFHPHVGVQIDRGLYAPLIIDDPAEPGAYDQEWVLVLDDWVDGTGRTPDQVLATLMKTSGSGMGGMHHNMGAPPWGSAGDVEYPYFLINGKPPQDPEILSAKPGQRVRLRIINAGADTVFAVSLGEHKMRITHTDGYPVVPQEVNALYIGMGERYDVSVTLGDGVFAFMAAPFGKAGTPARALIRTGAGQAPAVTQAPPAGPAFVGSELQPAESSRLPSRAVDAELGLSLQGAMQPYQWTINGAVYGQNQPISVTAGQRVRFNVRNHSMMSHPLHFHGHTFALSSGLRKDTVMLAPMQSLSLELQADNPGDWMVHCHNAYHGEAGMMIALNYAA